MSFHSEAYNKDWHQWPSQEVLKRCWSDYMKSETAKQDALVRQCEKAVEENILQISGNMFSKTTKATGENISAMPLNLIQEQLSFSMTATEDKDQVAHHLARILCDWMSYTSVDNGREFLRKKDIKLYQPVAKSASFEENCAQRIRSSNVRQLLLSIGPIEIQPHEQTTWCAQTTPNTLVKCEEVPCRPGKPAERLFLLIKDDPLTGEKTKLRTEIESLMEEGPCTTVLLVAVSGAGKTKAALDILQDRFGFFMDASTTPDIVKLRTRWLYGIERTRNPDQVARTATELLLLSRVLLLTSLYVQTGVTPSGWLKLQLSGKVYELLERTFWIIVRNVEHFETLGELLNASIEEFAILSGHKIVIVLDEVHILLSDMPSCFLNSERHKSRPLLTPLYTAISQTTVDVILCTNRVLSKSALENCLKSNFLKRQTDDARKVEFLGSPDLFPYLKVGDIHQLLTKFFKNVSDQKLISKVLWWLKGRPSIAVEYIEMLCDERVANSDTLGPELLESTLRKLQIEQTREAGRITTLMSAVKYFVRSNEQSTLPPLLTIVRRFLLLNGQFSVESTQSFGVPIEHAVYSGIATCDTMNNKIRFNEPLMIFAAQKYMQSKNIQLADELFKQDLRSPEVDGKEAGRRLEMYIALKFISWYQTALEDLPLVKEVIKVLTAKNPNNKLPWKTNKLNACRAIGFFVEGVPKGLGSEDSQVEINNVDSFLEEWDETRVIKPSDQAAPDLVLFTENVLIVASLALRFGVNVNSSTELANGQRNNPYFWFIQAKGKETSKKKDVLQALVDRIESGKTKLIIALNICLPKCVAGVTPGITHRQIKIGGKADVDYVEVMVTQDNAERYQICSKEILEIIQERQALKKRVSTSNKNERAKKKQRTACI